jgi:hypothetical protein
VVDREPGTSGSALQRWIGNRVELHYVAGSGKASPHGVDVGQPEIRIGLYILGAVDDKGVEAYIPEGRQMIYVPWDSVLLIQGPLPEDPDHKESEDLEEGSPT